MWLKSEFIGGLSFYDCDFMQTHNIQVNIFHEFPLRNLRISTSKFKLQLKLH